MIYHSTTAGCQHVTLVPSPTAIQYIFYLEQDRPRGPHGGKKGEPIYLLPVDLVPPHGSRGEGMPGTYQLWYRPRPLQRYAWHLKYGPRSRVGLRVAGVRGPSYKAQLSYVGDELFKRREALLPWDPNRLDSGDLVT